jgi:ABC-type multidrug transport system ATPase subunit
MWTGLVQFIIAAIVMGGFSWNDGNNSSLSGDDLAGSETTTVDPQAYNVTSSLFVVTAMTLAGTSFALPQIYSHLHSLRQGIQSELHRPIPAWLSLLCVDVPIFSLAALAVGGLLYLMLGLESPHWFFIVIIVTTLCGYSLAAACALWCSSLMRATYTYATYQTFALLFCGYLRPPNALPVWWNWLGKVSFTRWAFDFLMHTAFGHAEDGSSYLELYGMSSTTQGLHFLWLLLWLLLLQLIAAAATLPLRKYWISLKRFGRSKTDDDQIVYRVDDSVSTTNNPLHDSMRDWTQDSLDSVNGVAKRNEARTNTARNKINAALVLQDPFEKFRATPLPFGDRIHLRFDSLSLSPLQSTSIFGSNQLDEGNKDSLRTVFRGVTGEVRGCESLCVIDNGTAGEATALLRALAGLVGPKCLLRGTITINGRSLVTNKKFLEGSYVQKDDVTLLPMTVRDAVTFTALMRRNLVSSSNSDTGSSQAGEKTNRGTSDGDYSSFERSSMQEATDAVSEALRMTGLADDASKRICTASGRRLLTATQLRCLTIACELVGKPSPSVIFLEDPLWGLHWSDVDLVSSCISSIRDSGRSIVSTLTSPSFRSVESYSKVLLLSHGYVIYNGTPSELPKYFSDLGNFDLAELTIDIFNYFLIKVS